MRLLLRYDKAVELAISSKNYDEAMELALEHKVILTEAMVEGMTLEKKAGLDDKALNAQRNELLLKIAATCKQQNSFHLAAKKCVGSASLAFVVSPPCLFVRPFVCFARQIHARTSSLFKTMKEAFAIRRGHHFSHIDKSLDDSI